MFSAISLGLTFCSLVLSIYKKEMIDYTTGLSKFLGSTWLTKCQTHPTQGSSQGRSRAQCPCEESQAATVPGGKEKCPTKGPLSRMSCHSYLELPNEDFSYNAHFQDIYISNFQIIKVCNIQILVNSILINLTPAQTQKSYLEKNLISLDEAFLFSNEIKKVPNKGQ